MSTERERHRLRVIADEDGVRSELVCPPTGCEHPVEEGRADESVACWIETWADNADLLHEHLVARVVLGEWPIDVEPGPEGEPRITVAAPAPASPETGGGDHALRADRDSWRRVAERLEGEKQQLQAAPSEPAGDEDMLPEPAGGHGLAELLTNAAHHLRNLPGTRESDDIRWAERLEQAAARLSSTTSGAGE